MKKTLWLILVLGSILLWTPGMAVVAAKSPPAPDFARAAAPIPAAGAYGRLPQYFVENQGQVDSPARFYSQGPGIQAGFSPREITLAFPASRAGAAGQSGLPPSPRALRAAAPPPAPPQVVRWRPVNLSRTVKLTGADPLPGKFNHFKGRDPNRWRAGLPTYGAVVYREAYPGVDLKFYGQGQQLEYDVIVRPGANPAQVRFRLEGVKSLAVTPDGDLAVTLPGGEQFLQRKPLVYQEDAGRRVPREGRFKLYPRGAAVEYGFEVAAYDRTRPLVIDPVLVYSTFFGGAQEDWGYKIAVDASGNAFVAGTTYSSDFLTYPGSPYSGGADVFVLKLNPNGSVLIFSTLLGGDSSDYGTGVALSAHNIFVCGQTYSSNFPTVAPLQDSRAGSGDAFVAKLSQTTGALLFSTYLGGTYDDGANAVATDGHYDVAYVTGYTKSNNFPPVKPLQAYRGAKDIFVAKIDAYSTPALLFSTFLGGSNDDTGTAIAVKSYTEDYYGHTRVGITGNTSSQDLPIKDGLAFKGGTDAFIIEITFQDFGGPPYDPYMSYATCLGGANLDYGTGIAHYLADYLVTGETNSPDFPVVKSSERPMGSYDVFLTSISSFGITFSTLLGGTKADYGNAIAVDSMYNIFVVGHTYSSDFPLYKPMYWGFKGATDAFVAQFSTMGKLLMSTLLGGSSYEFGNGIAIDSADNVFITGETASADFPIKSTFPGYSGGGDVFITKLSYQSRTEFALMMLLLLEDEGDE
jgi:hypothetical protein